MRLRAALTFSALLYANALCASVPADELFLPIVGRTEGATGRQYFTTVLLANDRETSASVRLSFLLSGQPNAGTTAKELQLPARGVTAIEVDAGILGRGAATGALRIHSSAPIVATARIYSRDLDRPADGAIGATFEAVPARFAIGNGESTVVPGVARDAGGFKLYLVETSGQPLLIEVSVHDHGGRRAGSRRLFLGALQAATLDLATFALPPQFRGTVRISGVNGSGKVIAAGELIASGTRDSTPFSMTLPLRPRHRLAPAEMLAYGAVALVLLVAAVGRSRRGILRAE
jgi:hypothetical protein